MKEETTKAGRLYGVCSAGECIVTDAETGLVLANLDGSKQEAFFAIGSKVYVSDDAAVVTEAFNLAPCRGVAAMMLLRKAGGWLPRGFTELEYLESSGTQYIDTGIVKSGEYLARFEYAAPPKLINGIMFGWKYKYQSTDYEKTFSFFGTTYYGRFVHWTSLSYILPMNFSATGYDGTARNVLETTSEANVVILNGETVYLSNLGNNRNAENPLNAPIVVLRDTSGVKLFAFTIFNESGLADIELTPVLRNSDGVAGMWDKVSKQFFENAGTGSFGYRIKRTGETVAPMSLRDPYYVPPSGVYARKVGENELEVIADTEETTGDGWEWFASTAEAYEYFGIVQEELLTE